MADSFLDDHYIETYKSLVALSVEGFKFCALANGGAAVALLTYLGNVASKGTVTPDMRCAMAAFLSGLFACGVAMLFAYLTQLRILNERAQPPNASRSHRKFLYASAAMLGLSLLAFAVGAWQAVVRFAS